jgi:glycosyltransferase involved in cell wall biosynthesis
VRVAFISPYPPARSGIADYSVRLVRELRNQLNSDDDVTIFSFRKDGSSELQQKALISLHPWNWLSMYRDAIANRYDVLHIQFDVSSYMTAIVPLCLLLYSLRRTSITKLAVTYHESFRDRDLYHSIAQIFYRLFSKLFDRIYVHSYSSRERLVSDYGVEAEKVEVIPHGTYEFASLCANERGLRAEYDIDEHQDVILFFGYVYRSKGIQYVIDAMRILLYDHGIAATLLICGEVPKREGILRVFEKKNEDYLRSLKEMVTAYGLDRCVRFVGYVPAEDVYSVFSLASVVVLPYTCVDQSGVLNIAIAAGVPVVGSDIGGVGETLSGVGVLVKPRDPSAIAGALQDLLTGRSRRQALVRAYARLSGELSTRSCVEHLLADYECIGSPAECRGRRA